MENRITYIPSDNILMEFTYKNKDYVVFSDSKDSDNAYIAQSITLDNGMKTLKNIESDSEYKEVENEYNRLFDEMGENDYE